MRPLLIHRPALFAMSLALVAVTVLLNSLLGSHRQAEHGPQNAAQQKQRRPPGLAVLLRQSCQSARDSSSIIVSEGIAF